MMPRSSALAIACGMNAPKEAPDKLDDLIEMGFKQPVPSFKKVQLGIRQIPQVSSGRSFRHVVVVRPPYDQGRRLMVAQVISMFREPAPVCFQSGYKIDGCLLAARSEHGCMQSP